MWLCFVGRGLCGRRSDLCGQKEGDRFDLAGLAGRRLTGARKGVMVCTSVRALRGELWPGELV